MEATNEYKKIVKKKSKTKGKKDLGARLIQKHGKKSRLSYPQTSQPSLTNNFLSLQKTSNGVSLLPQNKKKKERKGRSLRSSSKLKKAIKRHS